MTRLSMYKGIVGSEIRSTEGRKGKGISVSGSKKKGLRMSFCLRIVLTASGVVALKSPVA